MSTPAAYVPPVDQPPAAATATPPYGGFWIRFVAYSVDGMLIWLLSMVIAIVWGIAVGLTHGGEGAGSVMVSFAILAASQLYHAYFLSSEKMATPGKRWCGLYVTDLEGRRLTFGRALWRNLAASFSYLTLYIGFFMAGWTEKKQALHDKMAGTIVHRQPGGSTGALVIVIIVTSFIGIAIIGILAAIAIPAYQDFVSRAKLSGVVMSMTAAEGPVADYYTKNGQWPGSWEQAGTADPAQGLDPQSRTVVEEVHLDPATGAIVATVNVSHTSGALRMVPTAADGGVTWTCVGDDTIRRYLPAACRQ